MPRMISTSFMTGTGFMKCIPMNRSGRSVAAASRVIEMDEVFDAMMQDGLMCGTSSARMARLISSFSVAASMTMSAPQRRVTGGGADSASAPGLASTVSVPRLTMRPRLPLIVSSARTSTALVHVEKHHRKSCLGAHLGNAVAHLPGPDDANGGNFLRRLQRLSGGQRP